MVPNRTHYSPEYILCRQLAYYLRAQYPKVLFHFDPTGNHLTKTQAGMLKAIQKGRGWPDLFIAKPMGKYAGLFLELKPEGTRIQKKDGSAATPHITEQIECLSQLLFNGYCTSFACGFDNAKLIIDDYLNSKL